MNYCIEAHSNIYGNVSFGIFNTYEEAFNHIEKCFNNLKLNEWSTFIDNPEDDYVNWISRECWEFVPDNKEEWFKTNNEYADGLYNIITILEIEGETDSKKT